MIIVGLLCALALLWIAYHAPSAFFLAVLASFAIGLSWLLDDHLSRAQLAWVDPAHKSLLVIALIAHALRYGVRAEPPSWPVLAVALLLLQTMVLAGPDPALAPHQIVLAAFGLALPWLLVHMVLAPGTRDRSARMIMLLPVLCLGIGVITDLLGLFSAHVDGVRLQGATNSGWFGFLAFVGFAVATHEAVRTSRPQLAGLAVLNLSLVILSGGRMAMIASVVHALAYGLASRDAWARLRRFAPALVLGGALVVLVFVLYLPLLEDRSLRGGGTELNLSGRDDLWSGYLQMFAESPLFGHGLGATATGSYFQLPHNEYLRLLVEGGAIGFVLFAGALVLWGRAMLTCVHAIERPFLIALFLALGVYAVTDNVLIMSPAMVAFAYLAVVLSEPGPAPAPVPRRWWEVRVPAGLARRGQALWQWLRRRYSAGRS